MASPTTYEEMIQALNNYYSQADGFYKISEMQLSPDEFIHTVNDSDGWYSTFTTKNGDIQSITNRYAIQSNVNDIGVIDSNLQNASYGANSSVFNTEINGTGTIVADKVSMENGSKTVSTGSTVSTVAKKVTTGIAAVTAGCRLGKFFAEQTYQSNPDFWDEQLPGMNPDMWGSLVGDNELGQSVMQFLFGINPDTNETTAYMDENAFAYMAYAMNNLGFFKPSGINIVEKDFSVGDAINASEFIIKGNVVDLCAMLGIVINWDSLNPNKYKTHEGIIICEGFNSFVVAFNSAIENLEITKDSFTVMSVGGTWQMQTYVLDSNILVNGVDRYFHKRDSEYPGSFSLKKFNEIFKSGDIITLIPALLEKTGNPDGVSDQPDYTAPDTSTWTDPTATKESLKQQFPDYWNDSIYNDVPQPDGTTKRITYIPMPTIGTTGANEKNPTNETVTKDQIAVNPNTSNQDLLDTITRYITNTTTSTPTPTGVDNPPNTGSGTTPPVILPSGSASALWSIYNPSQAELNSFGSWLWSSDFVDQLKKLFADPMQAIIGVHKVFATPPVSGRKNIVCGYIDSGVSANAVSGQYVTVDCGSVNLREYFGNVFDYSPFTEVKLFLPFIGVVPLDTAYVMRASIKVLYHVDIITGACLAEISINRDSSGGILYTYGGSCIVQYPVSSGSYMGMVSGVLSAVGSAVGIGMSIASGNPLGALMGASGLANSVGSMKTNVQNSGGFSGSTGAVGGKKPYLIVSRPQTKMTGHEGHMMGNPDNEYKKLSSYDGYVRCKAVHVDSIVNATESEKSQIETLLKSGVLVN